MKPPVPDIIKQYGLDFGWDAEDVWRLDVPTETMSTDALIWHFEIPFWSKPGCFYDLTANEVLENPQQFKAEYARIQNADTSYPIDIMIQDDRWVILDGLHRLVKLVEQGEIEVRVRKIPRAMIPLIRK